MVLFNGDDGQHGVEIALLVGAMRATQARMNDHQACVACGGANED